MLPFGELEPDALNVTCFEPAAPFVAVNVAFTAPLTKMPVDPDPLSPLLSVAVAVIVYEPPDV